LITDQGTKAVQVLNHNALVISRNYEFLNIFMGFEQANQYKIMDEQGNVVGYIAEESSAFKALVRNLFTTHRSFKATVMDTEGNIILTIRRPFYFLNSLMYIEDAKGEVLGEIHQRWHIWRRKYDLYINKQQIGQIDSPFLSWDFAIQDSQGKSLALVDKNWTNFGREIFTDANQYAIKMAEPFVQNDKPLTLAERAIIISMAVAIDFNYFSKRSGSSGLWPFWPIFGGGGQEQTPTEDTTKDPKTQDNTNTSGTDTTSGATVNTGTSKQEPSSTDLDQNYNNELMNDKWASPNDTSSSDSSTGSIWDWFNDE